VESKIKRKERENEATINIEQNRAKQSKAGRAEQIKCSIAISAEVKGKVDKIKAKLSHTHTLPMLETN